MGGRSQSLEISFESPEAFEHEYATNISNGGIFVATQVPFEIRQKVEVRVKLGYLRKGIVLAGEIVHVIGPELAATGATPGVAVQLEAAATELRELFAPLVAHATRPPAPARPPSPADRRGSPRSRARVRARVECPGCETIEGRTRDLSASGVLVSMGSSPPIGVGEPVIVTIANPDTGLEREILGKVARHVTGDGGVVRAIAIQFHVRESDRKSVEKFLRELRATQHSRYLGGIQGAIAELGLASLVQTFGLAAREGTLDVIKGAEEGFVAFENGLLRAAVLGGTSGIKALARMLAWTEGTFEFHARLDPALARDEAMSLEAALLEATRLMDEGARVDRTSVPPHALLGVDAAARAAAGDLEKLDEAVLDLASAGMNVQRILDIVPESDSEIYLAIWTLAERGIVSVRDAAPKRA
jgi:Tfp pilus assembly protein PilZ